MLAATTTAGTNKSGARGVSCRSSGISLNLCNPCFTCQRNPLTGKIFLPENYSSRKIIFPFESLLEDYSI